MLEIKINSFIPNKEAEKAQALIVTVIETLRRKDKNPKEIKDSNYISDLVQMKNLGKIDNKAYSNIITAIINSSTPYVVVIEKGETKASPFKSILTFINRIFNLLK